MSSRLHDVRTTRVTEKYGKRVPRETWASEVTTRYIAPRQRLSREEMRERELFGTVCRTNFEVKRSYR